MFRCPECQSVSLVFNFNFEQPYAIRHDKKATEKKKEKNNNLHSLYDQLYIGTPYFTRRQESF